MHFECTYCKAVIKNPITPVGLCSCGKPLSVRYEWENSNIGLKVDTNEESLGGTHQSYLQSKTELAWERVLHP